MAKFTIMKNKVMHSENNNKIIAVIWDSASLKNSRGLLEVYCLWSTHLCTHEQLDPKMCQLKCCQYSKKVRLL